MNSFILSESKSLYLISATFTIGYLIAIIFFATNQNGRVKPQLVRIQKRIAIAAFFWAIATLIFIVSTLANLLQESFIQGLDFASLRSFVTQIGLGKFLMVQFVAALTIAVAAPQIKRVTMNVLLLSLALIGVTAPIFESHSSSGGSHFIAIGTLIFHVLAITFWLGSLIAITTSSELDRAFALKRYSQLATWAALTVLISGFVNAWIRMNFKGAWGGSYSILVISKVALTLIALAIALRARKRIGAQIGKLIAFESILLFVVLILGALLSNTNPPQRDSEISSIEALVGLRFPGTPNFHKWIFEYQPDALTLGFLIFAALIYFKGVRILTKRGDAWPIGRSISFVVGLLVINFAINGSIGVYAHFGFSYHMIEHMILGMIAPIALVLGAPITLALRTLPGPVDGEDEGIRNILVRFLHSKYAKFITNPVVALLIFDGSLFALYFTGLFGTLMGSHLGHLVMNFHFVMAGVLFFHVIVGVDPNPNRPPNIVRMVILFAAMSIHAFFSIALMSATTLLDGGYYTNIGNPLHLNLLENQYSGGAIGWGMGEIPILIALTAVFIQWMREDKKEMQRIDKNAARASAMGQDDELKKYNQYLAELARRDLNE